MQRNRTALVVLTAILALLLPFIFSRPLLEKRQDRLHGPVIFETISDYSHIRVRERDRVRSLHFVDHRGLEQQQSAIDIAAPDELQLKYTRALFVSFLFQFPQDRVLIVGLGGGGMVRYLQEHFPETRVDVAEIDPVIVETAAKWFETRATDTTTIHTADAFDFLANPQGPFDVIYMDAFLRPTHADSDGQLTDRLKTVAFLESLKPQLTPGGLLAVNLIRSDPTTQSDLQALESAFPTVYRFPVRDSGNLIVIATQTPERLSPGTIRHNLNRLREDLDAPVPFENEIVSLPNED